MGNSRKTDLSDVASASEYAISDWNSSTSFRRDLSFRIFDLLFVVLTLPFLIPVVLIIMAMIKFPDPAYPTIFKQTRFGLQGQPFTIFKFRTMVPNAETLKTDLISQSEDKKQGFKVVNDPRVTRIGRILRRTYLDELPQLFNVLQGDMSIVGPRANSYPPSTYEPWQLKRLEVKPGLTGDWQVSKGKTYDFRERCRIDNKYVDKKSLSYDALIILKTVRVCLFERNGQ